MQRILSLRSASNLLAFVLFFLINSCSHNIKPASNEPIWNQSQQNNERTSVTEEDFVSPPKYKTSFNLFSFNPFKSHKYDELSSPVIKGDNLYVGTTKGAFYSIDLNENKKNWKFKASSFIENTALIGKGKVYFGDSRGKFYCLNIDTGELVWSQDFNSEFISSSIIAEDTLYILVGGSKVYALNAITGERKWAYDNFTIENILRRYKSAVTSDGNNIYVLFGEGTLASINKFGTKTWSIDLIDDIINNEFSKRTSLYYKNNLYAINGNNELLKIDSYNGDVIDTIAEEVTDFVIEDNSIYIVRENKIEVINIKNKETSTLSETTYDKINSIYKTKNNLIILSKLKKKFFISAFDLKGNLLWSEKLKLKDESSIAVTEKYLSLLDRKGRLKVFTTGKE